MSIDSNSLPGKQSIRSEPELPPSSVWTIIPAAGIGRRMESSIPKQHLNITGSTILELTIQRLMQCPEITRIILVLSPDDQHSHQLLQRYGDLLTVVAGGLERSDSVLNGLSAIRSRAQDDDWVVVHDAARPCVRPGDINKLFREIKNHAVGGLLGSPVADTLKRATSDDCVESTVSRNKLWRAYTPQVFRFGLLYKSMQESKRMGRPITDESSAVELAGYSPLLIEGYSDNIKVTRPQDLQLARLFLKNQQNSS